MQSKKKSLAIVDTAHSNTSTRRQHKLQQHNNRFHCEIKISKTHAIDNILTRNDI